MESKQADLLSKCTVEDSWNDCTKSFGGAYI